VIGTAALPSLMANPQDWIFEVEQGGALFRERHGFLVHDCG
jgi:hypothetical protein